MSAIRQGKDGSLERATIERMKHLVREYELVKTKQQAQAISLIPVVFS